MRLERRSESDDLLSATEERVGKGVALVVLSGELDCSNEDAAREVLDGALRKGATCLIIDLGGLSFMDSGGVGLMIRAYHALRQGNGRLALVAPQPPILRLLQVACLQELLSVYPSVPQALADVLPGRD